MSTKLQMGKYMNKPSSLIMILACLLVPTANAVDGVLEINETCATQLGCFSGDSPGYPVTIDGSAGGSYKLSSNLIIPTVDTTGIEITSPSISIDLNGFEIVGVACVGAIINCTPASSSGFGIHADLNFSGISIKNGSVTGMGLYGIFLAGSQAIIKDIRARWNKGGLYLGNAAFVMSNITYQNNGHGIIAFNGSKIIDNISSQNSGYGIWTGVGSTITSNTSYNNGQDGIFGSYGTTITGNSSTTNVGSGIFGHNSCLIQQNTVSGNASYGLALSPEAAYRENVITDNTAGTVNGGFNMGNNFCNTNSVCP